MGRKNKSDIEEKLKESIRRIAEFPNPVELVNNMYGCHPDGDEEDSRKDSDSNYFTKVYSFQS